MKTEKSLSKFFLSIPLLLFATNIFPQGVTSYQAEDAVYSNAIVETEHSGFTGTGYVNYDNEVGGYIEWIIPMADSGEQHIEFRYANGTSTDRYLEIIVNGSVVEDSLSFVGTGDWTIWQTKQFNVSFIEGVNTLRATAMTVDGGPNIDKIDVTGDPGILTFTMNVNVIGSGNVDINPAGPVYDNGTVVTLTAVGNSPEVFYRWFGDLDGDENPVSIVMNSNKNITAVFIDRSDTIVTMENNPVGFATVNALGQNGTYGGEGGQTIYFSNADSLNAFFYSRKDAHFDKNYQPMIVYIVGKISGFSKEMMDVKETYDLTILGAGIDAGIEGFGFNVFRSHNIIIRNIKFNDCPDDAINITDSLSHHIWVDHCSFTDSPAVDINGSNHDGLLDIKHGASYITVSWNHFNNHTKTCLLGHSDSNGSEDIGRLKVTYHHNWFEDTYSRHPRVRFGEVHVYNNFYDGKGFMNYGIASTCDGDVVVESNYFSNVPNPTFSGYAASPVGDIVEMNNIYINSGTPQTFGTAFDPSVYYSYGLSNAAILPIIIPKYAGNGKFDETVPVELTVFYAVKQEKGILLKWITATELNNLGWEIQRLHANSRWANIGFVKGEGNSSAMRYYNYLDKDNLSGIVQYRLKQIDYDGTVSFSNIIEIEAGNIPDDYKLSQNYPNPFNPATKIFYSVPIRSKITLKLYDVLGNEIISLVDDVKNPGKYVVDFNAGSLASGIYYYRLSTESFGKTMKMVLLK